MSITIKRYPNRKLYDTVEKQYITLERIAELIRDGEEVHVVDNATGEDLTAVTLTQVLFEMEKKQAGFFSKSLLTGLVQSGGTTLDSVRRTLTAPLGLSHHVDTEIERRIDLLVANNEITYEEGSRLLEILIAAGKQHDKERDKETTTRFDRTISRVINERGIPSTQDVERLRSQVEALARMLDDLNLQEGAPAAKKAVKKTTEP